MRRRPRVLTEAWPRLLAGGLGVLASLWPGPAAGFCRTTTCDPALEADGCAPRDGCPTRGAPLFWPDACVTYAVHLRGSPLRDVSADELDDAMDEAFRAWLEASCPGGGQPSLGVVPLGVARCDRVEFNPPLEGRAGAPNANLVLFRDEAWPYPGERFVIARTSITYDPNTGAIFDADIELNSYDNDFSVGDGAIANDLLAVLTHEVGHFIGLDHSTFEDATMQANYDLFNVGARTLASDDVAGVCDIYAPFAQPAPRCPPTTAPHHGFSRDCGTDAIADASCLSLGGQPASGSGWWLGGLLLLLARRRAACTR